MTQLSLLIGFLGSTIRLFKGAASENFRAASEKFRAAFRRRKLISSVRPH